ncbi:MAG TPA: hypothetical protein GX525_09060 [Bacilli bacterium]|nr:hypothetical protein [Bacilli bacterium]
MNSITSYQPSISLKTNISKVDSGKESLFSIQENVAAKVDSILKEKNSPEIWEELSKKYNVRKATFEEVSEISRALYEAGEISLIDHARLTFDMTRASDYLRQHAPMHISKDFDMNVTTANHNGERDWIAEFEARAAKDLKYGHLIGHQNNMKMVSILQRLEASK